jgi:hypothetical protein
MSTQIANQPTVQELTNMSIYIPHVFPNFDKDYIADVFQDAQCGVVKNVDLVTKMDRQGKAYNAAYVHFEYWFTGPEAVNLQAKIRNPNQEARIMHQDPWFWICLENTAKKHSPGDRKQTINIAPGLPEQGSLFIEENDLDEYEEQLEDPYSLFLEHENSRMVAENEMLHANIEELHAQISNTANLETENDMMRRTIIKMFDTMMNSTTPEQVEALRDNACLSLYKMTHKQYKELSAEELNKLNNLTM